MVDEKTPNLLMPLPHPSNLLGEDVLRLVTALRMADAAIKALQDAVSQVGGGSAASAAILETARTIALAGAATGTATAFDGSKDISINVTDLDASKLSGTLPAGRISGIYPGFSHKLDAGNTVLHAPNTGSSSAAGRTVYGLAEYRSAAAAQVGAIVFAAPIVLPSVMHQLEVRGMLHQRSIVQMAVQGYSYLGAGTAWTDARKISSGSVDIPARWGYTPDGKACLILGDVTTSWGYPHISIATALLSHSVTDAYCTGWTVGVVTDLSLYKNVTPLIPNSPSAALPETLATARKLTIGSAAKTFNGAADVAWSLEEMGARPVRDPVQSISTATTAVPYTTYAFIASTTLTLPLAPQAGDWVDVVNRSGTTTAVIARNGQLIMGLAEDMTITELHAPLRLLFVNATLGWVLK